MGYLQYYDSYKDKIFSYFFYNLGGNTPLAEDLTSDTFLKAYEKFEMYDESYSFSTWIYTIARNTLYDHYRKQKIEIIDQDDAELSLDEFVALEQDFHSAIDTEIAMQQVYNALSSIGTEQKDVVVMKYLEELTTKEISHVTGKSEANIRKILSRAFRSLRQILISS